METQQDNWQKETSTCNCLVRKARNKWQEPGKVWLERQVAHYMENFDCFMVAFKHPALQESRSSHSKRGLAASFWVIDEANWSPIWGMKSKGVNNA